MKNRMNFFADIFLAATFATLMVGLCSSELAAYGLVLLYAFYVLVAVLGQRGRGRHIVKLLNHVHAKQLLGYLMALGSAALLLAGNAIWAVLLLSGGMVWALTVAFIDCAFNIAAQGKKPILSFPQDQP